MNPKDRRNQKRARVAKHLRRKADKFRYKGASDRTVDRLNHERRATHTQEA